MSTNFTPKTNQFSGMRLTKNEVSIYYREVNTYNGNENYFMIKATIPHDESLRLRELAEYGILDTEAESSFDHITQLASEICETKISVISLIDHDRQWFKSKFGLDTNETPRDISWCGHTILGKEIFEISDAGLDERFKDNPLYLNEPHVTFYAGVPLTTSKGYNLGTLCVIDNKPKKLSDWQKSALSKLAKQVVHLLESRIREKKLLEANSKLDVIVNHIPIMLSAFDEQGKFEWINNEWTKELGWNLDQMAGKDMLAEFYPDQEIKEEVLNFMTKSKSGWNDFFTRKANGSFFYTSWTNVKLPSGKSIGIGQNIHERKRLEKLTSDLQRMAKVGGWELILDPLELKWTDEVYRIHGIPVDKKIDLNFAISCYVPSERQRIQDYISKAMEEGTPWDADFSFCDLKGNMKWVRSIGEPIKNNQGKVYKISGTFQDVTENKNLLDTLEKQRKISQEQSKMASIGRLAAGVGHEINNPLAIIKGYLFVIQEELKKNNYLDQQAFNMLDKINMASDRIANIVKGLRVFSRSDAELLMVFDLNSAIEESYHLFKEIYHKEGIAISMNLNTQRPLHIYGNKGRIEQVIINLFSNAKDATEGQATRIIDISLEEIDGTARLTCRDNGKGIPDKIKDRIFDPFFTTKDVNQGTGIGLSIVSSILKEHDGEISFETSSSAGTTFLITIPISESPEQEERVTTPPIQSKPKIELSVLVVDDEEDIRNIMNAILSRIGIKIVTAENGVSALKALEKGKFDLIITDLKMPILNGIQLIKEVRSSEHLIQPKILLMTGGVDDEKSLISNMENMLDGYLYKPFTEKMIYEKIDHLFPEKNWNHQK